MSFFSKVKLKFQTMNRNRLMRDFENSVYGKRIAKFKNKYKGGRCFVIGNGPSLTADDLNTLKDNGEVSFATNRVYNIFSQTDWRPTYYFSEDPIIIRDIKREVEAIETDYKFIPINLKWYHGIDIKGAYYFYQNYKESDDKLNFSDNAAKEIYCTGTVTISCMQLAVYMGFKEIYLIGVDHNFREIIDENGEIVVDETVKDYFCDNYDADVKNEVRHDIGTTTRSYIKAKKFCDAAGIRVYNATRGGKLEVYDRVGFDSLFDRRDNNKK